MFISGDDFLIQVLIAVPLLNLVPFYFVLKSFFSIIFLFFETKPESLFSKLIVVLEKLYFEVFGF